MVTGWLQEDLMIGPRIPFLPPRRFTFLVPPSLWSFPDPTNNMSKRPHSKSPDNKEEGPSSKWPRVELPLASLDFPIITTSFNKPPPPFQKPMPIVSFSYDSSRTLLFDDSALRYFVDPPIGAQLSYGYDRWVRRPEEKGRLDGLLKAFSRAKGEEKVNLADVAVVSWRGVMTR